MTLSVKEFEQFKKFMMLTTSENDGEALAALRRANAVIAKAGVTWKQVLERVVKVDMPFESVPDSVPDHDDDLDTLFDKALRNSRGDFRNTILDIQARWQRYGTLSPKQRSLIERVAAER